MQGRINKRAVDALKAQEVNGVLRDQFLWDEDLSGFGCKVTPAGKKVYILQYRTRAQNRRTAPKRVTLGSHGELTAQDARDLAKDLLARVRGGADPARDWSTNTPTVKELATRFLDVYLPRKPKPPRPSTVKDYRVILDRHVLPALGSRLVAQVSTSDVERLHQAMRATPYQANRMLAVVHNAFRQAERWGWRPQHTNPAAHVDHYPEEPRGGQKNVMLTAQQMKALLKAIDAEQKAGADPIACAAIRFTFWTGWRINEVLQLEWDNIDLAEGTARLNLTKTSDKEYRSLPAQALNALEELPRLNQYVFPGRDPSSHLTTVKRPWGRIRKRAGLHKLKDIGPLRLHDLRHNVVSWDVSRGTPLEIAGKNVGHKSRQATEIYAHFAPDALKNAADERARVMLEALTSE